MIRCIGFSSAASMIIWDAPTSGTTHGGRHTRNALHKGNSRGLGPRCGMILAENWGVTQPEGKYVPQMLLPLIE